jgi:5-methylcytosine-specific restriction endonuclease McrA
MSKALRTCKHCSKEFVRYLSKANLANGRGQFCSQRCSSKVLSSRPSFQQPRWKGGMPQWKCLGCATIFKARPRQGMPRKYCSKECLGHANGQKRLGKTPSLQTRLKIRNSLLGERSHFWRGGVTPRHALIRESAEYAEWRLSVLKRDGYTCVQCHSTKNLHADHIKQFAFYPKLRFAIDNGRTLCAPCHRKTRTWGNNGLHRRTMIV